TVAALAVGMDGVAAQDVGIGDTFAAIDLGAIVHAAGLGPALLGDCGYVAVHLEDEDGGVVATRLVAMDVGAHVGIDTSDLGATSLGAAQQPAEELDGMAAHVHGNAAAGTAHVPEPAGVRAVVLLGLLDEMDLAESALVDELLEPDVLWREAELL